MESPRERARGNGNGRTAATAVTPLPPQTVAGASAQHESMEGTVRPERPQSGLPGDLTFGDFLRSRRERLSPEAVGLPAGGRRRTPGLRREEVALLAGISVDYLTRLEQGRETNPSQEVLESLGRVLHFGLYEWNHLYDLLGATSLPEKCSGELPEAAVEDSTRTLLDRLGPTPAFVLEQTADIAAWNRAFAGLMAERGLFDLDPPNLLRYTFLVPEARGLFREWEAVAAEHVGNLRVAAARWPNDRQLRQLVGELSMASPDFASLWSTYEVTESRRGRTLLDHPIAGELVLDFEALTLPGCSDQHLVTYLPADDATAQAIERLAATDEGNRPTI